MAGMVIVGAGQAGATLALRLRKEGYDGAVTLIGAEPEPPYQRPPLSKAYLLGEMARERLYLRPRATYDEAQITLITGRTVTGIDRDARQVIMGEARLPYDRLALTTGAAPRHLPAPLGGDLGGIYTVRSLADVDAMRPEFAPGRRLLVVGGGYVGLEAAAVARKSGLAVTLIEAAPRLLARVAGAPTAALFRDLHIQKGVDIHEDTALERLLGMDGKVTGAQLVDGTEIPADFVMLGIGAAPRTGLAETAGLALDNGIAVDALCRSSDPHIFAAGDCASFPHEGGRLRLESVGNAIDMADAAACAMLGGTEPYRPRPWFWSDQYDLTLQIAGLSQGHDAVVTRGNSFWYFRAGRLIAVDAAGDPRAYMTGRRWIEAGQSPDPVALADMEAPLKTMKLR